MIRKIKRFVMFFEISQAGVNPTQYQKVVLDVDLWNGKKEYISSSYVSEDEIFDFLLAGKTEKVEGIC